MTDEEEARAIVASIDGWASSEVLDGLLARVVSALRSRTGETLDFARDLLACSTPTTSSHEAACDWLMLHDPTFRCACGYCPKDGMPARQRVEVECR